LSQATGATARMIQDEPYYEALGNEREVFAAAYSNQLPVLLKGPTGCGKTRFVHHMAWKLQRPLITVACHDDLTAADLVGRYLVKGGETQRTARSLRPCAWGPSVISTKWWKPARTPPS
jgi:MoxR-like ATPase